MPSEYQDYSRLTGKKPYQQLFPTTHDECQSIIEWANQHNRPLVFRGAGSGTTGGAIATSSDYTMVNMSRMNRIIELDAHNGTITVEPGVILSDIHAAAARVGLFYPPDPASANQCTIGGNIATNAGGPRSLKYGVTRDYVIGLRGVWGNGTSFEYGGKIKKNAAGLDLIGLIVGSEGILAAITAITLSLRPIPVFVQCAIAGYATSRDATEALVNGLQLGISPSTAEFFTRFSAQAALTVMGVDAQFDIANAHVIWEVDGFTKDDVYHQLNQLKQHAPPSSTFSILDHTEQSNHIWDVRKTISSGLKHIGQKKYSEDIVVPIACIPTVVSALESLTHPSGIRVVGYGHLGDGNIHVNILKMTASDEDWAKFAPHIVSSVMSLAIENGGSISGEHGIGLTKKAFLPLMFSPHDLTLMATIKKSVDPNSIMNPGNMIDP